MATSWVAPPASAGRVDSRAKRPPVASSVCGAGRRGRARRGPARRPSARPAARSRRGCRSPCPRGSGSCTPAPGRRRPPAPPGRRGRRRTAPGGRRSRASGRRPRPARSPPARSCPGDTSSSLAVDRHPHQRQPQLLGEVLQQAADRRRHAAAVGAQAAELERLQQGLETAPVDRLVGLEHLVCPPQADAAGEALAAALVGAEAEQVAGQGAHVGVLVEADDAAVADHAALGGERVEVERGVELRRRQDAAERSADLDRLDRRRRDTPGQALAQLPHRRPEANLVDARVPRNAR